MMYKNVLSASYTTISSEGETVITITALQNNQLVRVTKEIKELLPSQYSFNSVSGTITLLGDLVLSTGETLFVIYKTTVGGSIGVANTILRSVQSLA